MCQFLWKAGIRHGFLLRPMEDMYNVVMIRALAIPSSQVHDPQNWAWILENLLDHQDKRSTKQSQDHDDNNTNKSRVCLPDTQPEDGTSLATLSWTPHTWQLSWEKQFPWLEKSGQRQQ